MAGAQLSSGSIEIQQKEKLEICQDFVGLIKKRRGDGRIEEEHEEFEGR
jgi:hypothetical protein